ncbi:MAG: peptidase, partial [Spirosoma sp.]|nr:peptidase [Spirosoma sp.]
MPIRLSVLFYLTMLSAFAQPSRSNRFVGTGSAAFSPDVTPPKYWILLDGKDASAVPALSASAIARRQLQNLSIDDTDRPVTSAYLNRLRQVGVQPVCQSRWLNAVSARLSAEQYAQVSALPFVTSIQAIDPAIIITSLNLPAQPREVNPMLAPVMTQIQA